jgi:hypothetical protein
MVGQKRIRTIAKQKVVQYRAQGGKTLGNWKPNPKIELCLFSDCSSEKHQREIARNGTISLQAVRASSGEGGNTWQMEPQEACIQPFECEYISQDPRLL